MTANATMRLANGHEFMTRMDVTGGEANGLLVLIVTSSISALAIVSLFTAIALSAWNTRKSTNEYLFVRSQAAVYLVCMLLCDLTQAVGSIMNGKWYASKEVIFEPFCTAQGALKQIADVGIAMWALVIAMHTFWVLFMEWRVHRYVMWGMLIFNWSAIATAVIAGPATMNMPHNGPFYGISGYWCWISDQYPAARVALDYAFMFFSAVLSFILYALIFLKLRGNIRVTGSGVKVRKHHDLDSLRGYSADDTTVNAAKGMMLYPVSYTIIILPITICRFLSWSGVAIPFAATIFSDVVHLLSGFINVCLFVFMRRVLPRHSIITKRFGKNKDAERRSSTFYDVPTLTGGDSEPSYISEKLSETETGHDDDKDKMFVLVDSPDADSFPHHHGTEEPLVPPTPSFAQRTPASAGVGSPGTAFSQSSPGTFARISLDNAYSPASRAQFPASAGGMVYPQSPIVPLASARSPVPPRSPLPALKSPQPVQAKSSQPLQGQARSPDGQGRSLVDGFRIITEE